MSDCVYPNCMMGGGDCDSQNRGECDPPKPASPPPAVAQNAGVMADAFVAKCKAEAPSFLNYNWQLATREAYLASHAAATASMRERLGEMRDAFEEATDALRNAHEWLDNCRENRCIPTGDEVAQAQSNWKEANEALAMLTAILEEK